MGMARVGGVVGGKVEATVLEQQIKKCEKGSYYFTFAIIVELEEICRI